MHDWGWHNMMWFIWIPIIILIVWFFVRIYSIGEPGKQTPIDILKRKYANGEITEEEFDKRKKKLLE